MPVRSSPPTPELEHVCDLKVHVSPPSVWEETPDGLRRIVPIVGGTVKGPRLSGAILAGGSDTQLAIDHQTLELEARYQVQTDDGAMIRLLNRGLRVADADVASRIRNGEDVPCSDFYFRGTMEFEAPDGEHAWLNSSIFLTSGGKHPDHVLIRVWRVQ